MASWTSLEPASVPVEPGASATTTLTVRNDGDTVSEYMFSVVGTPAPWTRLEPNTLRLYPGARGSVTVTFDPPRTAAAPAGPAPYGIRVRSEQNPNLFDVAEGRLEVGAFSEVRAELVPLTTRGRIGGSPRLTLENTGNGPVSATISALDEEDALGFRPGPPTMVVPPGGSATTRLRIRPRGLRLFRGDQRLPYTVNAQVTGPGTDGFGSRLESRGTFVRRPLLPRWLYAVTAAVVALALVGTGIYYGLRLFANGGPPLAVSLPTGTPPTGAAQNVPAAEAAPPAQSPPAAPALPAETPSADAGQNGAAQNENEDTTQSVVLSGVRAGDLLTRPIDADDVGMVARASQPARNWQRWIVAPADDGTVILVPATSDSLVLEQRGDRNEVRLRDADSGDIRRGQVDDRQKWRLENKGNNRFEITNVDSGDCLTEMGTGMKVAAAECSGDLENQQRWQLFSD